MTPNYESLVQELSNTDNWIQLKEQRRKAIRGRVAGWLFIIGLFIFGLLLIILGIGGEMIFSGFASLVMSPILLVFFYRLTHKNYSAHYKTLIVPRLVSDILNQSSVSDEPGARRSRCSFQQNKHINVNLLLDIPLFQKYNHNKISFQGEDLFSGTLGQTDFQFSDFVIRRNRDLIFVDQDVDLKVFKGLVFIADFHKSFEGTTTLVTRSGKIYKHQTINGKRIRSLGHEFERMFKVYTTDEITARYLLPDNMLERIVILRKLFRGKGMAICLHNGMLVISIHEVDFFESDGLKNPEGTGVRRTYEEIKAIIDIIEALNLNLRIWSKVGKDFKVK